MLLQLRFADITIKRFNINISLGFIAIFLYPGHESLPRQSHEGLIHDLMESNATIIPAPIYRTPATEPCAITPDSRDRSLKPASWKHLPIMDSKVQAVWKTVILSTISLTLSLCFYWTSVAFAYSVWSKTRTMLFNLSVLLILSDCTRTS